MSFVNAAVVKSEIGDAYYLECVFSFFNSLDALFSVCLQLYNLVTVLFDAFKSDPCMEEVENDYWHRLPGP